VKTFVKLSGVTDPDSVRLAPEGGAIGFLVGVPGAVRNLEPSRAAELVTSAPAGAEVWAVTRSPTPELIHQLFDEVGVDRVQVYGAIPEGLEFLEIHHLVPSLALPLTGTTGPEPAIPPAEDYSRLHLDAAGDPVADASGTRADWEMAARIVDLQPGRKLTLAGGLTAENVAEALAAVRPWGVDVGAGVEASPGTLDPAKVAAFLAAVEHLESGSG
jgi:phosphoribosylanthranilate isomerase